MNPKLNMVALKQVKNHLIVEMDKCNQARIKAEKENKIQSEVNMWRDMQVIYGLLLTHMQDTYGCTNV